MGEHENYLKKPNITPEEELKKEEEIKTLRVKLIGKIEELIEIFKEAEDKVDIDSNRRKKFDKLVEVYNNGLEFVGIKAEGLEDMIEKCDQLIIELQEKGRKNSTRKNDFTKELKSKVNESQDKNTGRSTTHDKNEIIDDKER